MSRNDGTHVFSETLDEHNRNVERWQRQYFRERAGREVRPGRLTADAHPLWNTQQLTGNDRVHHRSGLAARSLRIVESGGSSRWRPEDGMNTRDQFGNYLLLKKLTEDALGRDLPRRHGSARQGVERVVLLRVFNGQGLDGERLAQRIQQRAPLQAALKSPNLGAAASTSARCAASPYVAYDYISGKYARASSSSRRRRKHSPIPLDHALLIAERIALGLAVAYETRVGDERVLHGFLTPHLVLVSNEGELALLGFEASTGPARVRESSGGQAGRRPVPRARSARRCRAGEVRRRLLASAPSCSSC